MADANELVMTRTFDAPRPLVFEAWSSSEGLARWWGPDGFTTTTHAWAFEVGGQWRHTMHGPDGTDYPNRLVFEEIEWPARIVYAHHAGIDDVIVSFRCVITFEEVGEQTRLTLRQIYRDQALRDAVVKKYRADEGGHQTLARLAGRLDETRGGRPRAPALHLERTFDAPRRLVWQAWSDAAHLAKWFAPRPLTVSRCALDLRPGGVFDCTMRAPDGTEHAASGTFREVVPEDHLVFVFTFPDGNQAYTKVAFREHGGKTTLIVDQSYIWPSDATRGAPMGWASTLDQLGAFVTR